jgi:hypothetical protein
MIKTYCTGEEVPLQLGSSCKKSGMYTDKGPMKRNMKRPSDIESGSGGLVLGREPNLSSSGSGPSL